MKNITSIHIQREFSHSEAQQLLPIIFMLTEQAKKKIKTITNSIESFKNSIKNTEENIQKRLEAELENEIVIWENKVKSLGAKPKGLWLVDFDFGKGYFCWRFPETQIKFWHLHDEGFLGRKLIDNENSNSANQYNLGEFPKEF